MRCEEARAALIDTGYGQVTPELAGHLSECAACRAHQAEQQALDRLLDLERAPATPDAGFDARFFARVAQERVRSRGWRPRRAVLVLVPALAAAALALLLLRPHEPEPAALPPDDIALAMDLELIEDIDVVERLDELEAYDVLSQVDDAELERIVEQER